MKPAETLLGETTGFRALFRKLKLFREEKIPHPENIGLDKIHPLDEYDENSWLTPGERVQVQNAMMDRVAIKAAERGYKSEAEPFAKDVVGAEIFVRRLDEAPNKYIVGAACVTESNEPAIKHTPSILYFHPKEEQEWLDITQEERRKRLQEKVLPFIDRLVVIVPGWGNALLAQERIALEMLSGLAIDVQGSVNDTAISGKDMNQRTAILNLATMGANKSLDLPNKGSLTDLGILQQVYEAVDRVGIQVMQAKVEQIVSDPARMQSKIRKIDTTLQAIAGGTLKSDQSAQASLRRWIEYEREVNEILNGTWWNERLAVLAGHSMGGNKGLDFDAANYMKEVPGLLDYKKSIAFDHNIIASRWQEQITLHKQLTLVKIFELAEKLPKGEAEFKDNYQLIVEELKALPAEYAKRHFEDVSAYRREDEKSNIGIFPHVGVISLMAVLFGPEVDKQEILDNYNWLLKTESGIDISPERAKAQLSLLTDLVSVLVRLPIQLTRMKWSRLRTEIMTRFGNIGVVGTLVAEKIGLNALGFKDIFAAHLDTKLNQADFIRAATDVAKKMTPPIGSNTLASVPQGMIERLVRKTRIFAGAKDKTVQPLLNRLFADNLASYQELYTESIVRWLPESGHCISEEEFPQLMTDVVEFLKQHIEERSLMSQFVFYNIYKHFTQA